MNATLLPFFGWLLRSSGQAAILTVLILLVKTCLKQRLDGRWRHLLWLLVLVRLALPVSPPSPASLFNYLRFTQATAAVSRAPESPTPVPPVLQSGGQQSLSSQRGTPMIIDPSPVAKASALADSAPVRRTRLSWPSALSLLWAVGVLALASRAVSQNIFFRQVLRQGRPLNDAPTLEIFKNCKSLMGVKAAVALIETEGVKSPALYGLFQPQLLLPPGLVSRFGPGELRHIFLHELAHVRRRDIAVQWGVTWLQIIHWFNPILWLGFRRMAADREVACDELALAVAGEAQRRDYGRTIVKLLENFAEPSPLPGLVGILEDKSRIVQRIAMIATFKRRPGWSSAGIVAIAGLGLITLTEAQSETPKVVRPNLTGTVLATNDTRNDFGEELAEVFRPSSLHLGNEAGAQPAAEIIDVPALNGSGQETTWDWDAFIEKRRNILAAEYEVPLVTLGKATRNPDTTVPSLASSDFAKYLSNPPWIRQMTYLHWQSERSLRPGGETARSILETNLAAIQPNGYFKQDLAFGPEPSRLNAGGKIFAGMSKDYFWRGYSGLHQLMISPRAPTLGASDKNNPQILSGWYLRDLEQIRHLGLPALQSNTFAFVNDQEFSATTQIGEILKGRIVATDRDRPTALTYKVGDGTNPVVSVNYRYRTGRRLPSYIEIDHSDREPSTKMISIKEVEYGMDSRVPDGYEPAQFFPHMNGFDVQFWKHGERFRVAPDGGQVRIDR
jgi:beta-lactamase regulating signal transducer with metallopeptidase domain